MSCPERKLVHVVVNKPCVPKDFRIDFHRTSDYTFDNTCACPPVSLLAHSRGSD
jgi:hypothetical protein